MRQVADLIARRSVFAPRFAFSSFGKHPFLQDLGLAPENMGALYDGKWQTTDSTATLTSYNPTTEEAIASTKAASLKDYEKAMAAMQEANKEWRSVPMPVRGDIVRQLGEAIRAKKEPLGRLLSL